MHVHTAETPSAEARALTKPGHILRFTELFFFFFLRAVPMAYGGSQARGQIRALATGLHHSHSNTGSEPHLQLTPQPVAMLDP